LRITRVDTCHCRGGESPLWDPDEQALYFIDNFGKKVHRYDVGSGITRSWDVPEVITALALREHGGAVVALRSGVHFLDFDTGALDMVAPLEATSPFIFNDGKVDRRGRLVLGASTATFANPTPTGGLYSLGQEPLLRALDRGVYFSNGPCWSPDNERLYFSDSYHHATYAYDYDIGTGEVSGRRLFLDTHELGGMPDGTTVDRDGLLWMAIYGGGKVAAIRPDGRLERVVPMPVRLTSSVMFGGPNLDRLYVTTIEEGVMGEPREEGAGEVYMVEGLDAYGLPEPRYIGG
jgi:L-arabinonolactonase